MNAPAISLSIVSHLHGPMLPDLLRDVRQLATKRPLGEIELILTINVPEDTGFLSSIPDMPTRVIYNRSPKGFGANHNFAFSLANGQYFVVANPDIRLPSLDVDKLLEPFERPTVGAVAPLVLSSDGIIQDSARRFPTIWRLAERAATGRREPDYVARPTPTQVDWLAGMFVCIRASAWRSVGGFDERFFMYFEDVDLCRRLKLANWEILYIGTTSVIHNAQRASHRNLSHLRWHLRSAIRYFLEM